MGIAPTFPPRGSDQGLLKVSGHRLGPRVMLGFTAAARTQTNLLTWLLGTGALWGRRREGPAFLSWPPVGQCQLPGGSGDEGLNSWGPEGTDQASSPSQPAPPTSSLACPGALQLLSHGCHGNHRWLKFA